MVERRVHRRDGPNFPDQDHEALEQNAARASAEVAASPRGAEEKRCAQSSLGGVGLLAERETTKYERELREAELIWERKDTMSLNVEGTRGNGFNGEYSRKKEEVVLLGRRRKYRPLIKFRNRQNVR